MVANSATSTTPPAELRHTPAPAADDPIVMTRAEYEDHAALHWRLGRMAGFQAGIGWADRAFNTAIAEFCGHLPAPAHEIVAALVRRMEMAVRR
jgi:hypothetical protein